MSGGMRTCVQNVLGLFVPSGFSVPRPPRISPRTSAALSTEHIEGDPTSEQTDPSVVRRSAVSPRERSTVCRAPRRPSPAPRCSAARRVAAAAGPAGRRAAAPPWSLAGCWLPACRLHCLAAAAECRAVPSPPKSSVRPVPPAQTDVRSQPVHLTTRDRHFVADLRAPSTYKHGLSSSLSVSAGSARGQPGL